VVLTLFWAVSYALGYPPIGAHPIPNFWGMMIATACILQIVTGTLIDRRYDRATVRYFPYAVFYPIIYWMVLQIAAVMALPHLFKKPGQKAVKWTTRRVPTDT
jgi:biofilm PGA synthesis N-glycosyltransferase PgaC